MSQNTNANGSKKLVDPIAQASEEHAAGKADAAPTEMFLSKEDLFLIEMSQMRLQLSAALLREKRLDDQLDDATAAMKQLQHQVKVDEITIARLRTQRANEDAIKERVSHYKDVSRAHESLKAELGQRYGIKNFNGVAYDDVTGKITLVSELGSELVSGASVASKEN